MIMAIPADPAAMIPTSSMFTIDEHISTDRIQFLTPQKKIDDKIHGDSFVFFANRMLTKQVPLTTML
jgi:hypothetical protein